MVIKADGEADMYMMCILPLKVSLACYLQNTVETTYASLFTVTSRCMHLVMLPGPDILRYFCCIPTYENTMSCMLWSHSMYSYSPIALYRIRTLLQYVLRVVHKVLHRFLPTLATQQIATRLGFQMQQDGGWIVPSARDPEP